MFPHCIDLDFFIVRFNFRPDGGRSAVDGCSITVSMSWEHFRYNHLRGIPTIFNESPRLFERVSEFSLSKNTKRKHNSVVLMSLKIWSLFVSNFTILSTILTQFI